MPDDPRNPGGGGSTGFSPSMKIAGLPAWGWVGIAAAAGFVWFYARRSSSDQEQQPVTNTVTVPGADATDIQGQLATLNAQIRDLQGSGSSTSGGTNDNIPPVLLPLPKAWTGPHNTGPLPANSSLEALALKYWNNPMGSSWLYWTNWEAIENAAKKAGYQDSQGGTILVPGINLVVPPPLTQTTPPGTVHAS